MIRKLTMVAAAMATLGACARTHVSTAGGELATSVPPNAHRLTAGTMIEVKTTSKLDSEHDKVGDKFSARVDDAVKAQNGQTAVPEGSMVYGHITGLQNARKADEPSVIRLDFDRIEINGHSYPYNATITEVKTPVASSNLLKKAGIGAVAGGALGAIISGGDLSKMFVGAAIGAAAGTAISLGTDKEAELPEGTKLHLRTSQNIALK